MPKTGEKAVLKGAELVALQVVTAVGAHPSPAFEGVEVFVGAVEGRFDVFRHRVGRAATKSPQILWRQGRFARPRTATPQRLAARPIEPPVVKVRLDFGLTVPVHPSRAGNDADAKRHVNEGIAIARPRLDEADSFIRISRKAVGHDAAGRAAANDVVSVSAEP